MNGGEPGRVITIEWFVFQEEVILAFITFVKCIIAKKMHLSQALVFLLGGLTCFAAEPIPEELSTDQISKIKSYTGSWGKATGADSSRQVSRLDWVSPENLKKKADLAFPVSFSLLSKGRSVEGLENIKERIVDVRISNPNPYAIFFRGRQYKDNTTITPTWNKLDQGEWKLAGRDSCGTGVRDWEIVPGSSVDVMLYLHPELKEQQILGTFFKSDDPAVQSECLLYEQK